MWWESATSVPNHPICPEKYTLLKISHFCPKSPNMPWEIYIGENQPLLSQITQYALTNIYWWESATSSPNHPICPDKYTLVRISHFCPKPPNIPRQMYISENQPLLSQIIQYALTNIHWWESATSVPNHPICPVHWWESATSVPNHPICPVHWWESATSVPNHPINKWCHTVIQQNYAALPNKYSNPAPHDYNVTTLICL